MKKILAFITSLSMCLSMLTVISPAFACEDDAGAAIEETVELMTGEPTEEDDREVVGTQKDGF